MQTEWDIQPRSSACSQCNATFADKAPYHTLLSFNEGGYTRRDLCSTCWAAEGKQHIGSAVSTWQGIFKAPPPPPPEPIGKDTAENKLRELVASTDPAHASVRYILAVMLERKKILRHRDTMRQDGTEVLVYEHVTTGETFAIPDPHLRLDELEAVQRDVSASLTAPKA